MDWEGREFRVLGRETSVTQFCNFEIYSDGENGDVVNDEIFRRNTKIEDKYNVKITQTLVENPTTEMQTATLAGDDLYDLVFLQMNQIGGAAQDGFLYDLYDVDYLSFDKPWWSKEINESAELCGKLFYTSSDFNLRDKNRAYILIHNRDMAKEFNIPDIATDIRNGTWTIDKMTEYSKLVAQDLNGGGMFPVDDRWGTVIDSRYGFALMLYAMGNRITSRDSNGDLSFVLNNERMISSIDKGLKLLADEDTAFYCQRWSGKVDSPDSTSVNTFKAGNALFITTFPHSLKTYSADCSFDYGIIIPPKYDEEQEKYYSLADSFGMLFGIPSSTQTPEFSGYMLELISYESDKVLNAYYEITCKNKYTYDETSAEMLDLTFQSLVFDIGWFLNIGGMCDMLTKDIYLSGENNFASLYAEKSPAAEVALDEIVEKLAELD